MGQSSAARKVHEMNERIFNIFLYIQKGFVLQIGCTAHERSGSDHEKMRFLQEQVKEDYKRCERFQLPDWCMVVDSTGACLRRCITYDTFNSLRLADRLLMLEEVFQASHAPQSPLIVITPVVDGAPAIDVVTDLENVPCN
jgi:hypothetical protein